MNVLVTHPGRQHSHKLAQALHAQKALAGYWTGVPAADPSEMGPVGTLLARLSPQPTIGLPARLVRHNVVMPVVRRLAEAFFAPPRVVDLRHRAVAWFDAWAARRLRPDLDAVVAYENGARDTFRAAKKNEITTILDAASFHHGWQDDFYEPVEAADVHRRINRRKDEEVALADHILTVSELARKSYIDAGVPSERVTSVPMGADLDAFTPPNATESPNDGPFTFLFAGHASRRKGVDILLNASKTIRRRTETRFVLQFAGGVDDDLFPESHPAIERLGYLSRDELAEAFRAADCLVLPSRHDSFGRVVVEAMATGLPVLLSENVGAKEVVDEGKTGWIVPAEDADALAERMLWCIEHPGVVRSMRDATVAAAQDYAWTAYRERVTDVIASILNRHDEPTPS
jgi:glycosyltransferase involved in cell wall biosynthesis